jgi:hypothetical protein
LRSTALRRPSITWGGACGCREVGRHPRRLRVRLVRLSRLVRGPLRIASAGPPRPRRCLSLDARPGWP